MDEEEVSVIFEMFNNLIEAEEHANVPDRLLHNEIDPFVTLNDEEFVGLFRVPKILGREIIDLVTPYMRQGQNYASLEIKTKVLVALLFYAHGSYQKITGKNIFCGISQASVSRCINEVTAVFNNQNIIDEWIGFPQK